MDSTITLKPGDILTNYIHIRQRYPFGHAGLVYDAGGTPMLAQVNRKGLQTVSVRNLAIGKLDDVPKKVRVFRPKRGVFPQGLDLDDQVKNFWTARYRPVLKVAGKARFGSESFGPEAQKQLAKYAARSNWKGKGVYCSEFVILCIQLACVQHCNGDIATAQQERYFIQKDANNTGPHKLAKYLMNNPNFDSLGPYA